MKKILLSLTLLLPLAALPAEAGVYMTNEIEPTSNFCQAVAVTKDTYCPRVKVNCKSFKMKKISFFLKQARQCQKDPSKVKEKDARAVMSVFSQYQNALCCFSLSK